MRNVAFRYTNSEAISEEFVQDTFVVLLEYEGIFESMEHVKRFLYNVLKNRCLDWIRNRKVRLEYEKQTLSKPEDAISDFWDKVLEEDLRALLFKAIEILPPQCRKVMLHTLEGQKIAEIAQLMHISEETVKDYRRTSKQKLKHFFKKEFLYILLFI